MVTEKNIAQELQQNIAAVFQSQTQTTSVISNRNINTETTERTPPSEFTEISLPTSSTLIMVLI